MKSERVDMTNTPPASPARSTFDAKVSTALDSRHSRGKDGGGSEDRNNGTAGGPTSQFCQQQHLSRPQIRGACAENYVEQAAAKAAAREIVMTEAEKQKLVFHCQQAQGSPTGLISGFSNVKELYEKIAECYDFSSNEVRFWLRIEKGWINGRFKKLRILNFKKTQFRKFPESKEVKNQRCQAKL